MPLLIDGHNLIGAGVFDDVRLSDEDDEAKLVARLKVWKSRYRGPMTVIFDRGVPGGRDVYMGGPGVEVVFAADPAQADDYIRRRLQRSSSGLILVTNDDELRREAAARGVETWRGDEFVRRFTLTSPESTEEPGTEAEVNVSEAEVNEWLSLFQARAKQRQKARKRHDRRRKRVQGRKRRTVRNRGDDAAAEQRNKNSRPGRRPKGSSSKG